MVFVFGWDLVREGWAIEGRGHGEVVVLHRRCAEAAQERRQQDQRREDGGDDPAHRLAAFLRRQHSRHVK